MFPINILVQSCRPVVVCLQETKFIHIFQRDVLSILGQNFSSFVALPAQGTRGGILVAWGDGSTKVERYRVHRHSVTVLCQEDGQQPWWFSGIYGPHEDAEKPAFLDELREVRSFCTGP
jgi:hypothetical protein